MLVARHQKLFSDPDERLTFTTKVVDEIRTKSDSPTNTRFYLYPNSLIDLKSGFHKIPLKPADYENNSVFCLQRQVRIY